MLIEKLALAGGLDEPLEFGIRNIRVRIHFAILVLRVKRSVFVGYCAQHTTRYWVPFHIVLRSYIVAVAAGIVGLGGAGIAFGAGADSACCACIITAARCK